MSNNVNTATNAQLIMAAATQAGIPPSWLQSILNVENPSMNVNAVSPTGVQGLAQITHATWNTLYPGVPYSLDPVAQLKAASTLLATYQQKYQGDLALAAAAYNGGPGVANAAEKLIKQGVPEEDAIAQAAAKIYPNSASKQSEITNYVSKVTGQTQFSLQATDPASYTGVENTDVTQAVPLYGSNIPADQIAGVLNAVSPALIINSGLQQAAWCDDDSIVQADNVTSAVNYPVAFTIQFSKTGDVLPVSIKLMASMKNEQRSMRHVMNHQQTRTGILVNLWGSDLDTIAGSASTGVMMNQLGLTDFLSLSTLSPSTLALIQKALSASTIDPDTLDALIDPSSPSGAMRIAAKDAFFEFLAMFKNNGVVWFRNQQYTGVTTGQQQTSAGAWSPSTGSSTFQNAARRNDVMARGKVTMYYRNSAYCGYFKSLNATMDARNPFRWNFNFVFKVESSSTIVEVPS